MGKKDRWTKMFCPSCKALLRPSENLLKCPKCSFTKEIEKRNPIPAPRTIEEDLQDVPVFTSELDTMPIDEHIRCPKCENQGAYWHLRQTRAADEATTRFYRCVKCKHTWREYA